MTVLKFDLDIDAEIQKLGLPIANPANPANRLGSQIKISNPYNELSPIPDRSIHIEEATHLYQKRGWIQIFSGYLNQSVYLVKNKSTRVPDLSIPKYTKEETEALRGLTLDELKTLHEAKVIFKGEID
tara:strand:- start:18 stop:401 length:384 start_codon:yes stop_codon:yes gene_type:complete